MVCLIRTAPQGEWRLPKGMVETGESLEAAALREVREETGLDGHCEGLIDSIEYWFWHRENNQVQRHHKVVYFYLIKYHSGHTDNHDGEVDEARWMFPDQAVHCLTFAAEKKMVEKALAMIAARGKGMIEVAHCT